MTIADLIQNVRRYDPSLDPAWLESVYAVAEGAHREQRRASGESYIEHPLAVAAILADLEMDRSTSAASLLHDVVEDTVITSEEVAARFGDEIASLVDGVTKLTRIPYQTKEDAQVENLRKMFLAMHAKRHPRHHHQAGRPATQHAHAGFVAAGETANDRARNARDLRADRASFRYLAHEVGSRRSRATLPRPRLVSRYCRPRGQKTRRARSRRAERARRTQGPVRSDRPPRRREWAPQALLFDSQEDAEGPRLLDDLRFDGRPHHRRLGQGLLRCALGGRALDLEAAAGALQRLHRQGDAQAQHVPVAAHDGGRPGRRPARGADPHARDAPHQRGYGIAAHWRYKEGAKGDSFEQKLTWLRSLLEWQTDMRDSKAFMESLKLDLFDSQVFVFSPKGDVYSLAAGSTPLDFAYQGPFRRRQPLRGREGQRPDRSARLRFEERRHRRGARQQVERAPVVGLALDRQDVEREAQDQTVVPQRAQGRELRSRPGDARRANSFTSGCASTPRAAKSSRRLPAS